MGQVSLRARRRSIVLVLALVLVVGAQLSAPGLPASATGTLVSTPTSTVFAQLNTTTALAGMSISGDATSTLQATLSTTSGTLSISSPPTGVTLAYGNSWTGSSSITFSGLQSAINTALGNASLVAGSTTATASVSLTAMVLQTGYNYLASNQHFYQYVASSGSGISWTAADAAAKSLSYAGQPGYLATIPSSSVNNFISTKIASATNVWFGARAYESTATNGTASLATVGSTTYPRVWRWVSGNDESPISGQVISTCTAVTGSGCTTPNGTYSSWNSGEPNNSGGSTTAYSGEYVAVTNWQGTSGSWNDLGPTNSGASGYVVEYGGKTNNDASLGTGFSGVVTSSTAVSIAAAASAPSAPTITAVAGNASAVVTWNPPADGGSPITSYQYSVGGGTWTTFTPTATSAVVNGNTVVTDTATVPGLTNGTAASIQVRAVNGTNPGLGAASNTVTVTPLTVPDAPTSVVATRGNASASVAFVAPASNGGSAITGYTATATPGGLTGTCASSPCSVTGLTNGTAYTFTVHATNTVGDGAESVASASVTPATLPGVPTGVTATPSDSSASVAFTAPAGNGAAITSYLVTASPGGATATCSTSPCLVTGLTNGTAYTFTVRATNAVGNGSTSSASSAATPSTVPGVPTSVVATRGNASASVAFTAPSSTGGLSISSYTATASPGGATASCSSSPCAVTGLTNGTAYTFTVHATNADGAGAESTASSAVTPATVPGVPASVTATRGNTTASVAFTAPAANGSPITGYTVTTQPGGVTASCSSSPCTITGLTNGTAYTFTVLATNAVGDGGASASSAGVTPATVPGAPTSVVATRGDTGASVAFVAPGSTGGSSITGYTATASPGGATGTCTSSPCTVTGLTNGTAYTFTVHATNAVGDSVESAASALVTPATVPGIPTGLVVTPADGAVSVAFTAPSDHGSAITNYLVTASPGGASATCTTSPCAVTGLTNGTSYTFTVQATNGVGSGGTSAASAAAVPVSVPGAPTSVVATRGDSSASVAFTAPVSTGGSAITSYTATASPGGASATCTTSPCLVTGLSNGTSYTFTVAATNAVSVGPSSSPSAAVVPAGVPNAPTAVVPTRGDTAASIAFAAPAANGSPITGYVVTATPGGSTTTCSSSPCTVTGLANGTAYTFTVRASNGVGFGSDSAASGPVVPATVPGAPTGLTATRGDGRATVDFSAPPSNGGSAITGYRVTASPGGATAICTAGPCTVTGLTNGANYTLSVHAVNDVGDGPDASSPAVTPATVPGAPTGVHATAQDGAVAVSWTAPADSGGDPITGYRLIVSPTGATLACAASPCTVSGLVNGRAVSVRVVASNSVGDSAQSAASSAVTPAGVPATPTGFIATVGDGTAQLEFDAPSGNGAAISGYEISLDQGVSWRPVASSGSARVRITVSGLDNGTSVDIQVRAVNAVGASGGAGPGSVRPVAPPAAPSIVGALAGDRSVSVSWIAPLSSGGVPLTGYVVTANPGGRTCGTDGATGCVVRGLTNGVRYSLSVRATTGLGSSIESAAVSATPVTLPGAPTGVGAVRQPGAAIVTFTAPADTGGAAITGYVVRSAARDQRCAASPCRVDGLTNGTAYRFRVAAITRVGTGPAAAADSAVVPADRPGVPTALTVTAHDGSVDITFRAPADHGSDITGYLVSTDGGVTWTPLDVTLDGTVHASVDAPNGVPVGIAVRAVNGMGAGAPAAAVYSVPATTPAAPTGVRVTPGDGSAVVAFAAADAGGSAVSSYVVVVSPGGHRVTCTSSPCTIDGLTNGEHYSFTVFAKNGVGRGPAVRTPASVVAQAKPITVPPPTVKPHRTTVDVSWDAPPTMPSTTVTGYSVQAWPGGTTCTPVPATATHCTVTGLTPGKVYAFTVSVTATGGHSATSPQSRSIALASSVEPDAVQTTLFTTPFWLAVGAVLLGALFFFIVWRRRRRDREA